MSYAASEVEPVQDKTEERLVNENKEEKRAHVSHSTSKPNYLLKLLTEIAKQSKPAIKVFSGSVDKFVPFKAKFERIERRGIYDEEEMLDLLLDHVSGDAEKAVKRILPRTGKFKRAMKILEERFGNAKSVVNAKLKALRSHPPVQGHNSSRLGSLSDVISTMLESFRSLKLQHELKSSFIVQEAVAKLPTSLLYK